jgi:hypothetical protein
MFIVVVLLGVVVAGLTVLVLGLLRSHAEIVRILHDMGMAQTLDPAADPHAAPQIRTIDGVPGPRELAQNAELGAADDLLGVTPAQDAVAIGVAGQPNTTLLAFLSSGCQTCSEFWRAFRDGEADVLPGRSTRLVVVTKGPEHESPGAVAELAAPGADVVMSTEAWLDYDVPVAPYFVLVDGPSAAVIGEGAAASWAQVAGLLKQAADDEVALGNPGTGEVAPGGAIDLDRFSGRTDPSGIDLRPAGGAGTAERLDVADAALRAAGVQPGDPSLYADPFGSGDDGDRGGR